MTDERTRAERTAFFGYREVPESAKGKLVAEVFHSVADKYDLMNDLMSFGIHRLWKRFAVATSGVRRGRRVLDLAGGTGDMAALLAARVGSEGEVVLADINSSMLAVGRARLADRGLVGNVRYVQADAERLPFPADCFDLVTIAFGLRNVTRIERALAAIWRVLKPGGALVVLEFSRPRSAVWNRVYDAYSFSVLPWLGRVVARDEAAYRYLAESIRKHPDQQALCRLMEQAGFERVDYYNLSGGIVAVHKGYKL